MSNEHDAPPARNSPNEMHSDYVGNCPPPNWWRRRDDRAVKLARITGHRASDRTFRRMKFAVENGTQELVAALNSDSISVAAASVIAALPAADQIELLAMPAAKRRQIVRILRSEGHGP